MSVYVQEVQVQKNMSIAHSLARRGTDERRTSKQRKEPYEWHPSGTVPAR